MDVPVVGEGIAERYGLCDGSPPRQVPDEALARHRAASPRDVVDEVRRRCGEGRVRACSEHLLVAAYAFAEPDIARKFAVEIQLCARRDDHVAAAVLVVAHVVNDVHFAGYVHFRLVADEHAARLPAVASRDGAVVQIDFRPLVLRHDSARRAGIGVGILEFIVAVAYLRSVEDLKGPAAIHYDRGGCAFCVSLDVRYVGAVQAELVPVHVEETSQRRLCRIRRCATKRSA